MVGVEHREDIDSMSSIRVMHGSMKKRCHPIVGCQRITDKASHGDGYIGIPAHEREGNEYKHHEGGYDDDGTDESGSFDLSARDSAHEIDDGEAAKQWHKPGSGHLQYRYGNLSKQSGSEDRP